MNVHQFHSWPSDENEAIRIQEKLREKITLDSDLNGVELIAGVDTSFNHHTETLYAGVSLFRYPELTLFEKATASRKAEFPYIPGLYAFREGQVILKALNRLKTRPDVVIFAGHGIAHPRRFGMACHMGLLMDIPSIGCARKRLAGQHQEIGSDEGEAAPLYVENKLAGQVYRSRTDVKPIYISPGYKCSIADASRIVTDCLSGYRLPEPLRTAHRLANRIKQPKEKPQQVSEQ
ncbi:MAG: deoxyribonuclease V [FCB group bacterium]|nr:deoxyribonuclease V [FCB group bacterium]